MTQLSTRSRGRRWVWMLALAVVALGGLAVWGMVRTGPRPEVKITTERPAIGRSMGVTAKFSEPSAGLAAVTLEIVQGAHSAVLAQQTFGRRTMLFPFTPARDTEATLEGVVGRDAQGWLEEGDAVLRATATPVSGMLRHPAPVVVEQHMAVRLRPPVLAVLSTQHYVTQGGSGVVVLRVGQGAVRSGVRAGKVESLSAPMPDGSADERFVLFAMPWDMGDGADVRAFAEDDAGNRIEIPFLNGFKPAPPRTDTITLSDAFLERVVPAIAAETPDVPTSGSLLDRYLWINGTLRSEILAKIRSITADSVDRFLWHGRFVQMPNTAALASFAQRRTYLYEGKAVDHQTHLGLDLASTSHAPVPAANAGRVIWAGWLGIYGNAVILDHGYGLASLYGHLSSIDVKVGDAVEKGQTIAHTGATGLAGGDHLHLEFFLHGESVSPLEWLDANWIRSHVAAKLGRAGEGLLRE